MEFYNDYRPHQRLGYLTPNKVEDEYYRNYGYINIDITIAFTLNRLRYESKTIGTKYRKHSNWWRWWESNPRPRVFPKDFLRAQPLAAVSLTRRPTANSGLAIP